MRTQPSPAPAAAAQEPATLKAFITSNATLITIFSVLSGLAAFALSLQLGWFGPALRAGLLLMAVLVWIELLGQLPEPLLLSNLRRYPSDQDWRLVWFGYLLQLLMVALLFAGATAFPSLFAALAAAVVATWLTSRLPDRVGGLLRIATAVVVFEIAFSLISQGRDSPLDWLWNRFA